MKVGMLMLYFKQWEAGAMWGTLAEYWHYTGDSTYNNITTQALIFQSENSYNPGNWSLQMGNDDQGFWGMSAMLAAEVGFPDPPKGQPQWLGLAQGVFNSIAWRWETESCGGGLRWQVYYLETGYDYKNTISNGIFFNMGARLARYTHNETYAEWAEKAWDWMVGVGYIDQDYNVYDGGHIGANCTDVAHAQWSYNAAVIAEGLAYMYDHVSHRAALSGHPAFLSELTLRLQTNKSQKWETHLTKLVNRTLDFFFQDGIAVEIPCELPDQIKCKTDQFTFKGFLHRWLATTTQLAPYLADPIMAKLRTSAVAAARNCNPDGTCGFRWTTPSYDGLTGAGQQLSSLAAMMSVMVAEKSIAPPLTSTDGGTSKGDPGAGSADRGGPTEPLAPISQADRVGAGIVTTVILASLLGCVWWLFHDEAKPSGPRWFRRGD